VELRLIMVLAKILL